MLRRHRSSPTGFTRSRMRQRRRAPPDASAKASGCGFQLPIPTQSPGSNPALLTSELWSFRLRLYVEMSLRLTATLRPTAVRCGPSDRTLFPGLKPGASTWPRGARLEDARSGLCFPPFAALRTRHPCPCRGSDVEGWAARRLLFPGLKPGASTWPLGARLEDARSGLCFPPFAALRTRHPCPCRGSDVEG